jgi:hypothetical protein
LQRCAASFSRSRKLVILTYRIDRVVQHPRYDRDSGLNDIEFVRLHM